MIKINYSQPDCAEASFIIARGIFVQSTESCQISSKCQSQHVVRGGERWSLNAGSVTVEMGIECYQSGARWWPLLQRVLQSFTDDFWCRAGEVQPESTKSLLKRTGMLESGDGRSHGRKARENDFLGQFVVMSTASWRTSEQNRSTSKMCPNPSIL